MKLNRPASLVRVVRVVLVDGSIMRTSAPTSAAPCGSVTCPDTVPDDADCAGACTAPNMSRAARQIDKNAAAIPERKLVNVNCTFKIFPLTQSERRRPHRLAEILFQASPE